MLAQFLRWRIKTHSDRAAAPCSLSFHSCTCGGRFSFVIVVTGMGDHPVLRHRGEMFRFGKGNLTAAPQLVGWRGFLTAEPCPLFYPSGGRWSEIPKRKMIPIMQL